MLILYQFPISHYCEKIRWTLDYKQLPYEVKNLLPGFHASTTQKLSSQTSVPILAHDQQVIQGSNEIINYLDEKFPDRSLTPKDSLLKEQALAWENFADKEIGIPIRCCFYHILLDYPEIVIPLFTHNGPWYGKPLLKCIFPKIKSVMKQRMNINEEAAKRSRDHLTLAIDKLYEHLQSNDFLVGNQFTRADLSAAALLAPLYKPAKYGLQWPDKFPQQLEDFMCEFQEKTLWVNELYGKYR